MLTILTLLITVLFCCNFFGCAEVTCPPVSTPNGAMAIFGKGQLSVYVACNGKPMEVVSMYKFDYCPSEAERKILTSAIDSICTNPQSTV